MLSLNLDSEQVAVLRTLYAFEKPVSWTEIAKQTWTRKDQIKFLGHVDGLSGLGLVERIEGGGNGQYYQLNSAGIKITEALIAQESERTHQFTK